MNFCYNEIAKLFDAQEFPLLNQHLKTIKLKKGDTAVVQGQCSPGLWYLNKGNCRVTVQAPGDKGLTKLDDMSAGSVFGEISFIDRSQCTATVTAKTNCECLVLPYNILSSVEILEPEVALACINAISRLSAQRIRFVMREINKNWHVHMVPLKFKVTHKKPTAVKNIRKLINDGCFRMMPEFDQYTEEEIESLCRTMPCYEYSKGSQIFNEGDNTLVPYSVLRGAVQTYFKNKNKMGKLSVIGPGTMVGLTSFVDHGDRPCSAFAREHSLLMAFTEDGLKKLMKKDLALFNKLVLDLHKTLTKGYRGFLMHLLQAQSIKHLT